MAKNKMKSNKSVRKRMKVTGTGKIKRRQAGMSHLMSSISPKRKRKLRKGKIVKDVDQKRYRELIGD